MISVNVFFAILASCPTTHIVNKTNEWDDQDKKALATAKVTCKREYKESPCLKVFKKVEEGIYSATCGAPK